jgi:aspartokinase-like uncharacterized kinase
VTLDAVVKLGGSLLADACLPLLLRSLGELGRSRRLLVVPGGGPFADAVRRACALRDPGTSAAHWMAILAMDQHAHLLASWLPGARLVAQAQEALAAVGAGEVAVLAPYAWLRASDSLPHGWHVTSDSIAAWVAQQVGARRLVLLKAVEGVGGEAGAILPEVSLDSPALAGIIDEHFAHAVEPGQECWILSGRHPERLAELLRDGRARGTRVG